MDIKAKVAIERYYDKPYTIVYKLQSDVGTAMEGTFYKGIVVNESIGNTSGGCDLCDVYDMVIFPELTLNYGLNFDKSKPDLYEDMVAAAKLVLENY